MKTSTKRSQRNPRRPASDKSGDCQLPSSQRPHIAITGATGFIGRQLSADCVGVGFSVSALTRSVQANNPHLRWVTGDLDDQKALQELVEGASAVVHLAGATKALRKADFERVNCMATQSLASICDRAGVKHFIHMSSLAASRPNVSPYAASKAAAEEALLAAQGSMRSTIIRAPAVLGPSDSATVPLFSNLAKGLLPIPGGPAGKYRFSIIDVVDLSQFVIAALRTEAEDNVAVSPYGHQSVGWDEVATLAEGTIGKPVRQITVPWPLLWTIANFSDLAGFVTGKPQVFSKLKLSEMKAGNWIGETQVSDPTPLEQTLLRCLAPYQRHSREAPESLPQELKDGARDH